MIRRPAALLLLLLPALLAPPHTLHCMHRHLTADERFVAQRLCSALRMHDISATAAVVPVTGRDLHMSVTRAATMVQTAKAPRLRGIVVDDVQLTCNGLSGRLP